jgi:dCTP deaminase
MLLSDIEISRLAQDGMIEPYVGSLIREVQETRSWSDGNRTITSSGIRRVLSYGQSSYGYDISLSAKEFLIFRHIPGTVIDPKNFNPANLEHAELHSDEQGEFFILPAHSYGLGVAVEKLRMPPDVTGICLGKSTMARTSVILNATPAESGWEGHLTLEFSNGCGADVRIYANEGICQVLFFRGEPCSTTYHDRAGKYQGQECRVTLAKV